MATASPVGAAAAAGAGAPMASPQPFLTDTDYESMPIHWKDCEDYEIIRKVRQCQARHRLGMLCYLKWLLSISCSFLRCPSPHGKQHFTSSSHLCSALFSWWRMRWKCGARVPTRVWWHALYMQSATLPRRTLRPTDAAALVPLFSCCSFSLPRLGGASTARCLRVGRFPGRKRC
jgi:hypothetical protein